MEIKVLRRYDYKADIEIDGIIYKGVYPIDINIDNKEEIKDNKITIEYNIPEELLKDNK